MPLTADEQWILGELLGHLVVTAKPRTSPAAEDAPVGGRRPGVPVFRLLGRAPQASTERSIR